MKIKLTVTALICFFTTYGQKMTTKYISEQLNTKQYPIDTSAEAVILYEKQSVTITNGSKDGPKQKCHVYRLVKIVKPTAVALAEVNVILPVSITNIESLHLKGSTFNFVGDELKETNLDPINATIVQNDTNYNLLSFALPAVRSGSVAEYEYDVETPYTGIICRWEVNGRIPKLKTEIEVIAPAKLRLPGIYPSEMYFKGNNVELVKMLRYNATKEKVKDDSITHQSWSISNLPALKAEVFLSNPENYKTTLELQATNDYEDQKADDWGRLNGYLWNHPRFGMLVNRKIPEIKKLADSITGNTRVPIDKAKRIFNYVRNNFDCNNNPGIFSRRDAEQIVRNRIASEAEINLVLVALLRAANLKANPIILSMLGKERVQYYYAWLGQFNYTACIVNIDYEDYYLDGSGKFNCFGTLPIYCYNGEVRAIGEDGVLHVLENTKLKDQSSVNISVPNLTDSSFVLDVVEKKGKVESIFLRSVFSRDTAYIREYVKKRMQYYPGLATPKSYTVDNIDNPDADLIIRYSVNSSNKKSNAFAFPSDILKLFSSNPFLAEERQLPIEFPSCHDFEYKLTLNSPEYLHPINIPEQTSAVSANATIRFDHFINYDIKKRQLQVNTRFSILNPNVPASNYPELKSLFSKMETETAKGFIIGQN